MLDVKRLGMKRRLFNLAAVASLVLCLLSLALCVRGQFVQDTFSFESPGAAGGINDDRSVQLTISRRGLLLSYFGGRRPIPREWHYRRGEAGAAVDTSYEDLHAFIVDAVSSNTFRVIHGWAFRWYGIAIAVPHPTFIVGVGHWVAIALSGLLPAVWIVRQARRHRKRQFGLCRVCGYDLRATPERCPECGTIPQRPIAGAQA
jgi:hypothetical protein